MTQCSRTPPTSSGLGRRKIVADFNGGDLTSDGGLPLLREVDRRIGLLDALDAAIRDPRCPWLIEHDQRTLPAQRLFAIAAGYDDLNDHQTLRNDPLLKALSERRGKAGRTEDPSPLSSPPTLRPTHPPPSARLEMPADASPLSAHSPAVAAARGPAPPWG